MKLVLRVLLILVLFSIFSKQAVAQCSGIGNYCVGQVVQQWSYGCDPNYTNEICKDNWGEVHSYNCNMDTCTVSSPRPPDYFGKCGSSSVYSSALW